MENKIEMTKLAQYQHMKVLKALEKGAVLSYRLVMTKLSIAIRKAMKKNRLVKSEDPVDGLESGWTEGATGLAVDVEEVVSSVIDKHLSALRWVMLGGYAGPEAEKAAKAVGLKGKVTPGVVQAAYLQSIDSHTQHYFDVVDKEASEMPADLIKASFEQIFKKTSRILDSTLEQLKSEIIGSVERAKESHDYKTLNEIHKEAHNILPQEGSDAAEIAAESMGDVLKGNKVVDAIKDLSKRFENKWDMTVKAEVGLASATGTHQSMLEIYGRDNADVRVAWIEMEDERVCSFCRTASKKADGTHRLYKMSDFEPSGFNYGRKKADWRLTIPPVHPRCRCSLVYVPPGFSVDKDGGIYKKS